METGVRKEAPMKRDFDVTRFRKLVALFDSDKQGEADSAFRMAAKMCAAHGLRFPEMLAETFGETRIVYEAPPRWTWRERCAAWPWKRLLMAVVWGAVMVVLSYVCAEVVRRGLGLLFGRKHTWTFVAALFAGGSVFLADWPGTLFEKIVERIFARWS